MSIVVRQNLDSIAIVSDRVWVVLCSALEVLILSALVYSSLENRESNIGTAGIP